MNNLNTTSISFRKLGASDMELLYKWLTTDFVHQWYDKDTDWTYDKIAEKYTTYMSDKKPVKPYIIMYNDKEIGYIQTYLIGDYPDYAKVIDIDKKTAGVDIFIGEADYIHIGLGSKIIRKFVYDIVFNIFNVACCIIAPEPANTSAIKAYEKAGFKYIKTVYVPEEDDNEYVMIMYKD